MRHLSDMVAESVYLGQNHLSHLWYLFNNLESEIERLRARRLVGGIVPDVEIWVLECFFD